MAFLLKLIDIVLLLVALIAFYKSWKAKKSGTNEGGRQRNDPLAFAAGVSGENDFNPKVIGPGAILSRGGIDYVVRGTVTLSQGPFVWHEHMIDGGSGSLWLSVEVDEGQLELVLWNPRKDLNLPRDRTRRRSLHHRRHHRPARRRRHELCGLRRPRWNAVRPGKIRTNHPMGSYHGPGCYPGRV